MVGRLVTSSWLGLAALLDSGAHYGIAAAASDVRGSPSDRGRRYRGAGGRGYRKVGSSGNSQSFVLSDRLRNEHCLC